VATTRQVPALEDALGSIGQLIEATGRSVGPQPGVGGDRVVPNEVGLAAMPGGLEIGDAIEDAAIRIRQRLGNGLNGDGLGLHDQESRACGEGSV
jgi:hypothetical protein